MQQKTSTSDGEKKLRHCRTQGSNCKNYIYDELDEKHLFFRYCNNINYLTAEH